MRFSFASDGLLRRLLASRVVFWGSLVVLIALLVPVVRIVHKRLVIRQQIKAIETEVSQLQASNASLKDFVTYLHSDAYKERLAREELNLQAPGESVVALPEEKASAVVAHDEEETKAAIVALQATRSNPEKWWEYFFGVR